MHTVFVQPSARSPHARIHGVAHQAGHGSSALGSSLWLFTIQVFPSLLLAGAGLVSAGILLDIVQVQTWILTGEPPSSSHSRESNSQDTVASLSHTSAGCSQP